MAQKPLVGYGQPEEPDDSDTEEPGPQLDIDDDDDHGFNSETFTGKKRERGNDSKRMDSSGGSSVTASQSIGELRPTGSLVSYVGEEESDDEEDEDNDAADRGSLVIPSVESVLAQNDGTSSLGTLSPRSLGSPVMELSEPKREASIYAPQLPPEPEGRCSRLLQMKISRLLEKKERGKLSLNEHVQRKKDFRNPSIYEKLVLFCSINETGSNYPKKQFDPNAWGPESFYDALAKAQKEAHEKKEREKKNRTQVDFVTATKKNAAAPAPVSGAVPIDDKLKRSKWDKPAELVKAAPSGAGLLPLPKPMVSSDIPAKKPKLVP